MPGATVSYLISPVRYQVPSSAGRVTPGHHVAARLSRRGARLTSSDRRIRRTTSFPFRFDAGRDRVRDAAATRSAPCQRVVRALGARAVITQHSGAIAQGLCRGPDAMALVQAAGYPADRTPSRAAFASGGYRRRTPLPTGWAVPAPRRPGGKRHGAERRSRSIRLTPSALNGCGDARHDHRRPSRRVLLQPSTPQPEGVCIRPYCACRPRAGRSAASTEIDTELTAVPLLPEWTMRESKGERRLAATPGRTRVASIVWAQRWFRTEARDRGPSHCRLNGAGARVILSCVGR